MLKPLEKRRRRPQDVNQLARQLVDESTAEPDKSPKPPPIPPAALSAYMSELGRKGGRVSGSRRKQNLSPERRAEIALKAARARWAKTKRKKP
jgi:hypothetical protein